MQMFNVGALNNFQNVYPLLQQQYQPSTLLQKHDLVDVRLLLDVSRTLALRKRLPLLHVIDIDNIIAYNVLLAK